MGYRLRNVEATILWLWLAPQLPYALGKDLIGLICAYLFDYHEYPFDKRLSHKAWSKMQCCAFMDLLHCKKGAIVQVNEDAKVGKPTALVGIAATLLLQERNTHILTVHVGLRRAQMFMNHVWDQVYEHVVAISKNSGLLELADSRNVLQCISDTLRSPLKKARTARFFERKATTFVLIDDYLRAMSNIGLVEMCMERGSKIIIMH